MLTTIRPIQYRTIKDGEFPLKKHPVQRMQAKSDSRFSARTLAKTLLNFQGLHPLAQNNFT